ncbi:MAG TPA: zinc-ribbon domain-containing protein [Candidatus Acidoferrales bacterium]|nr:zinc-ribbon domain-containing protein [Candidatus Acidoferrales bacterium]
MAGFCTKCGSALTEGNNFCTACGAPIGAASAAPGTPAAGTAAPAAAVPPKSGALKIILIVLGVFVGLGILAGAAVTFGIWRLSRGVRVDRSGQVSISTPGGKISVGPGAEVSEADLGVPLYPGAKREEGSMQLSSAEGSMATYVFKTGDSPAQVIAFYRGKLSPKTTFFETPDGGLITSESGANVGFMITIGREANTGQTSIAIVRGTSKKAQ